MAIVWKNIAKKSADIRREQLENNGALLGNSPPTFGESYYVNSAHGNAADGARKGTSKDRPFKTIAYAVTRVKNADDVIWVMPGHTETISTADAWKIAKAGIFVVGLGAGTRRPTITFTSSTAGLIAMDMSGLTFQNLRFVVGVASLVTMISITADGCRIIDCEFIQDNSAMQAVSAVTISNAAADRCKILGCNFESINLGASHAITITAAVNDLEIGYCRVFGDYGVACIETVSACTNVVVHDCWLATTNADELSIQFTGAVTGFLIRNMYHTLLDPAIAAVVDPGSCRSFECYACDLPDLSGVLEPVAT